MKITNVQVVDVRVPMRYPLVWSGGTRETAPALVVRVETDQGLAGLGECVGPAVTTVRAILQHDIIPLLLGEDAGDIERLMLKMALPIQWYKVATFAVAGVEMALWDLKGKALGVPLAELFGGYVRREVSFAGYIFIGTPEHDAELARHYLAQGYRAIKMKVGRDPAVDEARLAAVREAVGPGVPIRIDPNQAWSPATAIRLINRWGERYNLQMVEQPVPITDLRGLAHVRRGVGTPISADESCATLDDALRLIDLEAVDVFVVYTSKAGGLTRAREIAAVAEAAGIPCVMGTWAELGIGTAAMVQVLAATRNFPFANDTHYMIQEGDVITTPLGLHNGAIAVPAGPGLGVELDDGKLAHYHLQSGKDNEFYDDAPGTTPPPRFGQTL